MVFRCCRGISSTWMSWGCASGTIMRTKIKTLGVVVNRSRLLIVMTLNGVDYGRNMRSKILARSAPNSMLQRSRLQVHIMVWLIVSAVENRIYRNGNRWRLNWARCLEYHCSSKRLHVPVLALMVAVVLWLWLNTLGLWDELEMRVVAHIGSGAGGGCTNWYLGPHQITSSLITLAPSFSQYHNHERTFLCHDWIISSTHDWSTRRITNFNNVLNNWIMVLFYRFVYFPSELRLWSVLHALWVHSANKPGQSWPRFWTFLLFSRAYVLTFVDFVFTFHFVTETFRTILHTVIEVFFYFWNACKFLLYNYIYGFNR